jgi:hypothetical protein
VTVISTDMNVHRVHHEWHYCRPPQSRELAIDAEIRTNHRLDTTMSPDQWCAPFFTSECHRESPEECVNGANTRRFVKAFTRRSPLLSGHICIAKGPEKPSPAVELLARSSNAMWQNSAQDFAKKTN